MTQRTGGKRWRLGYLWVVFASPIAMLPFVWLLLLGLGVDVHVHSKSALVFMLTTPMVIAYAMVRIYYWRQDMRPARQVTSPSADVQQNAGSR
jgi:hypothetical protein